MKNIPSDVYDKIVGLAERIRLKLKKKGLIIPSNNKDGTVQLGEYTIIKNIEMYAIVDRHNKIIISDINLPQTAAILANDLALGKVIDSYLIDDDKDYGYALFEETLYKQILKKKLNNNLKNYDSYELILTRSLISKSKKEARKISINKSFEKLRKLA